MKRNINFLNELAEMQYYFRNQPQQDSHDLSSGRNHPKGKVFLGSEEGSFQSIQNSLSSLSQSDGDDEFGHRNYQNAQNFGKNSNKWGVNIKQQNSYGGQENQAGSDEQDDQEEADEVGNWNFSQQPEEEGNISRLSESSEEVRRKLIQQIPYHVRRHFQVTVRNTRFKCKHCRSKYLICPKTFRRLFSHLASKHPELQVEMPSMPLRRTYDKSVKPKYLQKFETEQNGKDLQSYYLVKGRRSWVWSHFLYGQDSKEAKCKHCDAKYNVRDGSTSGMLRHMTLQHESMIPKVEAMFKNGRLGKPRGSYNKKNGIQNISNLYWNPRKLQNKFFEHPQHRLSRNEDKFPNSNHLEQYQKQNIQHREQARMNFIKPTINIQYLVPILLQKYPLSTSCLEIIQQISMMYDNSLQEIKQIVGRNHWSKEKEHLRLAKKIQSVSETKVIREMTEKRGNQKAKLEAFAIITNLMRNQYERSGDCVILCYLACKRDLNMLVDQRDNEEPVKGIIHIIGQNSHLDPTILGIIVLKSQEDSIVRGIIYKYFTEMAKRSIKILVVSPQRIFKSISQLNQHLELPCNLKKQMTLEYLGENLFYQVTKNKEEIIGLVQNDNYTQLQVQGNIVFGGLNLFVDIEFLQKIEQSILNFNIPRAKNLNTFLVDFFGKQKRLQREDQYKTFKFFEQIDEAKLTQLKALESKYTWLSLEPIMQEYELREMLDCFTPSVFQKIYVRYFIGRFYLIIDKKFKNKNKLICNLITTFQKQSYCPATQVSFDLSTNCWECQCRHLEKTGVPCHHLFKVLVEFRASLMYYISSRWRLQKNRMKDNRPFMRALLGYLQGKEYPGVLESSAEIDNLVKFK